MYNKCPNIIKMNHLFFIETFYIIHYKTEIIIKPDLDVIIKEKEKEKCLYITNCLFIKCPICITFQRNCIIQECGHCICKSCLNIYIQSNNIFRCWICRKSSNKKLLLKL